MSEQTQQTLINNCIAKSVRVHCDDHALGPYILSAPLLTIKAKHPTVLGVGPYSQMKTSIHSLVSVYLQMAERDLVLY